MGGKGFAAVAMLLALQASNHAAAAVVNESEPNNSIATADNIDGAFTTDFVAGIHDLNGNNTSTTIPHATYRGSGQLLSDFFLFSDYFSFTVPVAGTRGVFDVDSNSQISNTKLFLYDSGGNLLAENDNAASIDVGSQTVMDPFLRYTFQAAGLYVVGIGGVFSFGSPGGITGLGLFPTDTYDVHASLNAVPEPVSMLLFGAGVAGLVTCRRRKKAASPESMEA